MAAASAALTMQPHRDNWVYPAGLRLVFDRIQYERELGVPPRLCTLNAPCINMQGAA
jgi:hypothetical protein